MILIRLWCSLKVKAISATVRLTIVVMANARICPYHARMLTATMLRGDVDGNENFDCDDGPQQKSSTLIHRAARQNIEFVVVVDRSASSRSKYGSSTNGNMLQRVFKTLVK
jgi:hypothetical protein